MEEGGEKTRSKEAGEIGPKTARSNSRFATRGRVEVERSGAGIAINVDDGGGWDSPDKEKGPHISTHISDESPQISPEALPLTEKLSP